MSREYEIASSYLEDYFFSRLFFQARTVIAYDEMFFRPIK